MTDKSETKADVWEDNRVLAAIFYSLSAHVVTIDRDGRVEAASRSWIGFPRERGGEPSRIGRNVDYLGVCRRAAEQGYPLAQKALEAIEAVLSGRMPRDRWSIPAPNRPDEKGGF